METDYQSCFSLSAGDWRTSTTLRLKRLFGKGTKPYTSFKAGPKWTKRELAAASPLRQLPRGAGRPAVLRAEGVFWLMRFVEDGGHLVVQYQRSEFNPTEGSPSPYAPFPARVTTKRVTDETAPLEMLLPESALLTTPNRLGPPDFTGWVQERGIQLLEPQDPRYRDLLASTDGFPGNPGRKTGLLVDAPVGKGSWTYVGLVLFRQLPAGVPGAYRLLANLISRPRGH